MDNNKCTRGALNKQAIDGLIIDHNKLVEIVDKIRNRPPLSYTVILNIILLILGLLVGGKYVQ